MDRKLKGAPLRGPLTSRAHPALIFTPGGHSA